MATLDFRGRTPVPLAFGTSGLRGRVEDLTDLEAWICTRGFLSFMAAQGIASGPVAVAGDLRPSTPRILRAVCRAVKDDGSTPVFLGEVPTPALTAYGLARKRPSIMVTGSHIPFDRNGIKFNRVDGEVLKSDEAAIVEAVEAIRADTYAEAPEHSIFDDRGALRPEAYPTPVSRLEEAAQAFLQRYTRYFGSDALSGLRIGVYQHSAVGRDLLVTLLEKLGAEVAPLGRADTFVPVDTEAVDARMLATVESLVAPVRNGRRFDAVVSTDGDSDRPLLLIDGEAGLSFVRGDTLGAMVCEDLGIEAVAVPVSASDQVDLHLQPRGVSLRRTRIGSPWVIAAFPSLCGSRKAGFEANGGFLLASSLRDGDETLSPLPTRDAFLPLVTVLRRAARRSEPLATRVANLPPRATTAGLLDDVDRTQAAEALRTLVWEDAEELWLGPTPKVRRAEGELTELETEVVARYRSHVQSCFQGMGLGALEAVNAVDGVRMSFAGGDVIHLRPSGNAPQFRLYATADSMTRAQELVDLGLAPDGPVARLLAG